ncbi:MAG TPA: transcriptional regulator [Thermoanaerobaculia bacterium]|nr:transcriptional regulator [Thermoanaerobaculia bacterium]
MKHDDGGSAEAESADVAAVAGPVGPAGPAPQTALDLDRLIHERMRLGIVSALAVNDHLSFNDLKRLLKTTDGNLSVHARKLEEAGYVACEKFFEGRVPKTEYRLTPPGRRALERYLDHMEAIIQATREG